MLVSITYGNENFQRSSSKYHVFACTNRLVGFVPNQKHLWQVVKNGNHPEFTRHGGQHSVDAAPGYRQELGRWHTMQCDLPEDVVLMLSGQRKLPEMVSGRETMAKLLLQTRETGPLIRVTANLTNDPRAQRDRIMMFEGRADVLSLQEARAAGVTVLSQHETAFADYNQDTLYQVEHLQDETSARPQVEEEVTENTQGQRVRVRTPRSKRAIQV